MSKVLQRSHLLQSSVIYSSLFAFSLILSRLFKGEQNWQQFLHHLNIQYVNQHLVPFVISVVQLLINHHILCVPSLPFLFLRGRSSDNQGQVVLICAFPVFHAFQLKAICLRTIWGFFKFRVICLDSSSHYAVHWPVAVWQQRVCSHWV